MTVEQEQEIIRRLRDVRAAYRAIRELAEAALESQDGSVPEDLLLPFGLPVRALPLHDVPGSCRSPARGPLPQLDSPS